MKKKCFVIGQIGEEKGPVREKIDALISGPLNEIFGGEFDIVASHNIDKTGSITQQIIEHLINADLVVADLTGLNANVMYELAVRHCWQKPTIIISENGTKLPFDIHDERALFFSNNIHGYLELRNRLKKVFDEGIDALSTDNPVTRAVVVSSMKSKETTTDVERHILDRLENIESSVNAIASNSQYPDFSGSGSIPYLAGAGLGVPFCRTSTIYPTILGSSDLHGFCYQTFTLKNGSKLTVLDGVAKTEKGEIIGKLENVTDKQLFISRHPDYAETIAFDIK